MLSTLSAISCSGWSREQVFNFQGPDVDYEPIVHAANEWNSACGVKIHITREYGAPITPIEQQLLPPSVMGQTFTHNDETTGIVYSDIGYTHAIMLHEFGHALGLQHVDDRNDIMYPVLNANQVREVDCQQLP